MAVGVEASERFRFIAWRRRVLIAESTDCLDAVSAAEPRPELSAQLADMHIDAAIAGIEPSSQHRFRKTFAADGSPGRRHQLSKHIEFDRRQLHGQPAPTDRSRRRIEDHVVDSNDVHWSRGRFSTSKHRSNARDQFSRIERLPHVIVGTRLEAGHAVCLITMCREHDDRNCRTPPDLSKDFKPTEPRQHHVEDHQAISAVQCDVGGAASFPQYFNEKPFLRQQFEQESRQFGVIIDHQKFWNHHAFSDERTRLSAIEHTQPRSNGFAILRRLYKSLQTARQRVHASDRAS
jgi:hypothetical protein